MVISQFVLGECAAFWFWKAYSHHPQLILGFSELFQLFQQTASQIKFRTSLTLQLKGNEEEFSLPFVCGSQLTAL